MSTSKKHRRLVTTYRGARRNEALARQLPEWATRRRPVLSAVEIVGLMETRYDVRRLCSIAVTE